MGLNAYANSFGLGQPAQSAQTDLGPNFSLSANFLYVEGPIYTVYLLKRSFIRKRVGYTDPKGYDGLL